MQLVQLQHDNASRVHACYVGMMLVLRTVLYGKYNARNYECTLHWAGLYMLETEALRAITRSRAHSVSYKRGDLQAHYIHIQRPVSQGKPRADAISVQKRACFEPTTFCTSTHSFQSPMTSTHTHVHIYR